MDTVVSNAPYTYCPTYAHVSMLRGEILLSGKTFIHSEAQHLSSVKYVEDSAQYDEASKGKTKFHLTSTSLLVQIPAENFKL